MSDRQELIGRPTRELADLMLELETRIVGLEALLCDSQDRIDELEGALQTKTPLPPI